MIRRDALRLGLFGALGGLVLLPPQDSSASKRRLEPLICRASGIVEAPSAETTVVEEDPAASPALTPFVDALPVPPVLGAADASGGMLEMRMEAFTHQTHRDLPPTTMWGYRGMWPGPTIDVTRNEPLLINWINALPARHLLPIDRTIHGAESPTPEVRTVVHVHGAQVQPDSDGYPDAWISPDGATGAYYQAGPTVLPNRQAATTLWYHDHAVGATRVNLYAGLAGMYLIHDEEERALNLPQGHYDIPLLIQDRMFRADGALLYPRAKNGTHPQWLQEFMGDVMCVNGRAMPYLEVEPRKYRFRLVNGCNSRFLQLMLASTDAHATFATKTPLMQQIGTDAGLLPAPHQLLYLLLTPGERADLVIDFSGFAGQRFTLANDAAAPYPRGGEVVPVKVMQFAVTKALAGRDTSTVPARLASYMPLQPAEAVRERILPLTEKERASDGYTEIGLLGGHHWSDPISEDVKAGELEIWTFANATEDAHPIHIHLVRFQVVNRQAFDVPTFKKTGQLRFLGNPIPPEGNERPAWKDTVKTYPGYVTRVIQRFDLPEGTDAQAGQQFLYVWHCHMLEHEDNEMMRPYRITA